MVNLQLLQLLLKASQDKRFVCEEADNAVKAMVESMTPLPLLRKLKTYVSHSNLRIRAKAAISISRCVSKLVRLYAKKKKKTFLFVDNYEWFFNNGYMVFYYVLQIFGTVRNEQFWVGVFDKNRCCCA